MGEGLRGDIEQYIKTPEQEGTEQEKIEKYSEDAQGIIHNSKEWQEVKPVKITDEPSQEMLPDEEKPEPSLEEKELRDDVLSRWENAESMTDEQLLEAMKHDGQLMIHVTAFAKEAVEDGYIVPTRILNQRNGKDPEERSFMSSSAAIHFGLNKVTIDRHYAVQYDRNNNEGHVTKRFPFSAFVTHPGIQMTNHDFGVQTIHKPHVDIQTDIFKQFRENDSRFFDVYVRGRSEDLWDMTQDIDIRSGFFLIPNLRIDAETLEPVSDSRLTREEYENWVHYEEEQQVWKDNNNQIFLPPEQYKYATFTKNYWEQIVENLPEEKHRPRIYFYDGATPSDGVAKFRKDFNIPEPKTETLIDEIKSVGSTEVIHRFSDDLPISYVSGEGHTLRLKSNDSEQDLHLPLANINIAQIYSEVSQRERDNIKSFIETHNPGPEWYQSQYASAYHNLSNIKGKLNDAYVTLRKNNNNDRASQNLIRHMAPELIKARARLEEMSKVWDGFMRELEGLDQL